MSLSSSAQPLHALAYYRSSNMASEGSDSLPRQQRNVQDYAALQGIVIIEEFYDNGVSGTTPIDLRPAFAAMLRRLELNGVQVILIEEPSRFARDLMVQITGRERLKEMGVDLVPVTCPEFFTEETPTANLIRQVLGAVAEFDRVQLTTRMQAGKKRQLAREGWSGGKYPKIPDEVRSRVRRLRRTGMSLRGISADLAATGYLSHTGLPYTAQSIANLLRCQ